MFCIDCGTQIPDGAKFCPNCGAPQQRSVQTEETKWETCEIILEHSGIGRYSLGKGVAHGEHFSAKAIGPNGTYIAARLHIPITRGRIFDGFLEGLLGSSEEKNEHDPGPSATDRVAVKVHDELIVQLVKDGWEPANERGAEWWSHRFRRRVK